jgi:hypothetical protein
MHALPALQHGTCIGGKLTRSKAAFFGTALDYTKKFTRPGTAAQRAFSANAGKNVTLAFLNAAYSAPLINQVRLLSGLCQQTRRRGCLVTPTGCLAAHGTQALLLCWAVYSASSARRGWQHCSAAASIGQHANVLTFFTDAALQGTTDLLQDGRLIEDYYFEDDKEHHGRRHG